MKALLLTTTLATLVTLPSFATLSLTNTWSTGFVNGTVVPDNNYSGWTDTRTISTLAGATIVPGTLEVTLNLSGGWNGDLYAYLVHGTGFAVLLDRVGYGGSGNGYGDTGFNITLASSGNPIESYQDFSPSYNGFGQLLGTWQAEGALGNFNGLDPNGTWTLFIADLSAGGVTTVQSWGLQMEIVAVPEVETWVAAALAGAFGAFWLNRQIWSGVKKRSS